MRLRVFSMVALLLLLGAAGCERPDSVALTAETEDPGFRRGNDLKRQGRNQEALSEYLKVIEKRGLNNAPEAHLEAGLIYSEHFKDPIAAIYHFRKYRELKPNSPQYDLVRQRIEAARREFSKSIPLPAQASDSLVDRRDMTDMVQRLQRENDQLKSELAAFRAGRSPSNSPPAAAADNDETPAREPARVAAEVSPVTRGPVQPAEETQDTPVAPPRQVAATPPARPPVAQPAQTAQRPAQGSYRRHTVAPKDNLYSLSLRYYGTRSRWRDIYAANRDVMRSDTDLRPGMELKIPQ